MSYAKNLENEINLYIKRLDELKSFDMVAVNSIFNEYADEFLQRNVRLNNSKKKYEQLISNCENLKNKIYERSNKLSDFIKKNGKKILKKDLPFSNEIIKVQNEIDQLVENINNYYDEEYGDLDKELEGVKIAGFEEKPVKDVRKDDYEVIASLIEEFKKDINNIETSLNNTYNLPIKDHIAFFMGETPSVYLERYYNAVSRVSINLIDIADYGNLMSVLCLAMKGMPFSYKCNGYLENALLSVECKNYFDAICINNGQTSIENESILDEIYDTEKIVYDNDGICVAKIGDYRLKHKKVLSVTFLKDILTLIRQNATDNLPAFAIKVSEKYCSDKKLLYLESFKQLYEETPEQIMVRDNRYYEEQRLIVLEDQAEQARKQREREAERAERWHQEQLEIQRENARAEQRRWEEDNRRADEQRKRDAEEERIRQRQQQREERDRMSSELKAKNEAIRRCNRCANHDACGRSRGVINCGAFRPKY